MTRKFAYFDGRSAQVIASPLTTSYTGPSQTIPAGAFAMTIAAIIVAAGRGLRAGGDVPKQWQRIGGRMVIEHSIDAFRRVPQIGRIIVVLHKDDLTRHAGFEAGGASLTVGGNSRSASVLNGLKRLEGTDVTRVLVHDAARPCVSGQLITQVIAALDHAGAAAPALRLTDALWTGADGLVTGTRDRTGLYRAQTPQGFAFPAILAAYRAFAATAADDVEVARAAGTAVTIVPGEADNLKITLPGDLARAERILGKTMDIRVGNGFDVHAFGPGGSVTLCGVEIAHDHGLKGHSDADVGMHAATDAIYGALARGDIGRHFPPSDPRWKGAPSRIFLAHAAELAGEMGFDVSNLDVTLVCEFPKITPHAGRMCEVMAQIMALQASRVSVKATTSEKLGFTGRGEGIAALASVSLVRR